MKRLFLLISFCFTPLLSGSAQVQSASEVEAKTAYIQGIEAFVNEEYDRSATLLLEAYKLNDSSAGINFALADVYFVQGDLPSAALYGKEAVNLEPENKWYRLKLAEIYRSAGQNQATLDELSKLLEYFPNDYDVLFMLADTQQRYGEFIKSNQTLNRILQLLGDTPTVLYRKFQNF